MTIRAVIFDLGHTLWDIQRHPDALERAYAEAHATLCSRLPGRVLPEADAMMRAVGDALRETYYDVVVRELPGGDEDLAQPPTHTWVERGLGSLGLELPEDLLLEITPPLFATEIDALVCGEGTRDAVAALDGKGYRIGCITNTLAGREAILAMLRLHGFEGLMRSVVVSSEEGWRKPHPSLFAKALRELDVSASEAVFVGDSPVHDIAGAKRAGMAAVLTRQYVARRVEGFEPQPDAIVGHVRELAAAIEGLDAR